MSKSLVLVIIQFSCIAYFLFTGPWVAPSFWFILESLGLIIGSWAIMVMHPLKVSVFPAPRAEATLITRGPYKLIRHPMYTAVLLVCAALAFDAPTYLDITVYTLLLINQVLKLRYEESLLAKHFPSYAEYKNKTWALVPYLF